MKSAETLVGVHNKRINIIKKDRNNNPVSILDTG